MIIQVLGLLCLTSYYYALPTPAVRVVRYDLCLNDANATEEEVKEFYTARSFDPDTEHRGFKCYAACVLIQHNILNNESYRYPPRRRDVGYPKPSSTEDSESDEMFDPAPLFSRRCGLSYKLYKADLCQYGFNLYKCIYIHQIMSSNTSHIAH